MLMPPTSAKANPAASLIAIEFAGKQEADANAQRNAGSPNQNDVCNSDLPF